MVKLTGSHHQVSRWQYSTAALMLISLRHLSPIHSPFAALHSIPVNPLNCLWPISLYPKWKCSLTGSATPAWKYLRMAGCIDTRACRVISPEISELMPMAWLWIIQGCSKGYEQESPINSASPTNSRSRTCANQARIFPRREPQ